MENTNSDKAGSQPDNKEVKTDVKPDAKANKKAAQFAICESRPPRFSR